MLKLDYLIVDLVQSVRSRERVLAQVGRVEDDELGPGRHYCKQRSRQYQCTDVILHGLFSCEVECCCNNSAAQGRPRSESQAAVKPFAPAASSTRSTARWSSGVDVPAKASATGPSPRSKSRLPSRDW